MFRRRQVAFHLIMFVFYGLIIAACESGRRGLGATLWGIAASVCLGIMFLTVVRPLVSRLSITAVLNDTVRRLRPLSRRIFLSPQTREPGTVKQFKRL